jgi:hypothetical protein
MLVLLAALALHFAGTTSQRLPLEFAVRDGAVRGLAVLARADCGRFGFVTEVQRFPPARIRYGSFRAVARDVPEGIFPPGDVAIVTGRLTSRRTARGTLAYRARRSDDRVGWIICTSVGVRWTARVR